MGEPGIESLPSQNLRHSYHPGMNTPRKLEHPQNPPTLLQRGPPKASKPDQVKMPKSQSQVETLDTLSLQARVAQLEMQLAVERQSRLDLERSLRLEMERLQQLIHDELPSRSRKPNSELRPAWQDSESRATQAPSACNSSPPGHVESLEGQRKLVDSADATAGDPAKAASPTSARGHQDSVRHKSTVVGVYEGRGPL